MVGTFLIKDNMDYTVIRRCMAIILRPLFGLSETCRSDSLSSLGPEVGNGISEGPGPPTAKNPSVQVFKDFVQGNVDCYWNPCLVQSVRDLEYRGSIAPNTLLVSGTEYSLEVIRSAWARRMLRAPSGFEISMLGDVNSVKMSVVPQTQFAPLPEALCKVVYDLNTEGCLATMSAIGARLRNTFPEIVLPEEVVLYTALGSLIRERKLFHTGKGYSVVTPDTFRLLAMSPPLERQMLLTNEEAIIRLHGTAVIEGGTASTQTKQKDAALTTWSSAERILSPTAAGHGKLKRCHSLKLLQRGRDKEKLSRSNSFRSSKEVENVDPVAKKEKPSMFSKWFRKNRDKKAPAKSSSASSQFPPRDRSDPDFVHYNSRSTQTLEKQERLPPKPSKSRSRSLNRVTNRDSLYLAPTLTIPKANKRSQQSTTSANRSNSLPRKPLLSSPKFERATRKPSPKPPTRQRYPYTSSSTVPSLANRSNFESSFSPISKHDNMLVKADDKYDDDDMTRQTRSVMPYKPITSTPNKPNPSTYPWRTMSSTTKPLFQHNSLAVNKPVSIGLPQRVLNREISPSTSSTVIKPQTTKTVTENVITTETTTSKKGLQIDGSVDVEINLGKVLSKHQSQAGTLNTNLDNLSKNDMVRIAATWNQSLSNNAKSSSLSSPSGKTLSTTTSVTTSISHGGLKGMDTKTVEVKCPLESQSPLKSTTVVDCTGKCAIVGDDPKTSNLMNSRSKLAEAKRDFFADSPSPTEPISLKDDSGFSSSASTSRPMSASPC